MNQLTVRIFNALCFFVLLFLAFECLVFFVVYQFVSLCFQSCVYIQVIILSLLSSLLSGSQLHLHTCFLVN